MRYRSRQIIHSQLFGSCKKGASVSSVLSTPSQVLRQKPKLIRALAAFQRGKWWPEVESNHRHEDFQSSALPTELSGHFELSF